LKNLKLDTSDLRLIAFRKSATGAAGTKKNHETAGRLPPCKEYHESKFHFYEEAK